jgi:hypothetical protein
MMLEPIDTSALGPVKVTPNGMLTRGELARQVKALPVGGKLTVERISETRVRIKVA